MKTEENIIVIEMEKKTSTWKENRVKNISKGIERQSYEKKRDRYTTCKEGKFVN